MCRENGKEIDQKIEGMKSSTRVRGEGGGRGRVNGELSRRGVEEGPLKLHVLIIPWWFSNDLMSVKSVLC